MDRRNNPGIRPRNKDQAAGTAPQDHPALPSDPVDLQRALESARDKNQNLERQLKSLEQWQFERQKWGYRLHKLNYEVNRRDMFIDLRDKQFGAEIKKSCETIAQHEEEISNLKKCLQQMQSYQADSFQEKAAMAAKLKAEQQKAMKKDNELLVLNLEKQKIVLLQNDLQSKVHQLEQRLRERDNEILTVRKHNDSLSHNLIQTTRILNANKAEFLESDRAWQDKYRALQETFSKEEGWKTKVKQEAEKKELYEKQLSLETTVQKMEEEKKELFEKQLSLETTVQKMEEEKKELYEKQLSLETTVQKMEKQKKEMEELCHKLRKKRRSFLTNKKCVKTPPKKTKKTKKITKLKQEKTSLCHRLKEVRLQLRTTTDEFQQSDKAWQTKHEALQQKFKDELAQKEQSWEKRVKELEEEKKTLAEKDQNWQMTVKQLEEEKTELENLCLTCRKIQRARKQKENEEKKEMKKKEKEEQKRKLKEEEELKKKQKEEKAEMKKKEKEEKKKKQREEKKAEGRWSRMFKKNDDSDGEEEEAAGCSAHVDQQ